MRRFAIAALGSTGGLVLAAAVFTACSTSSSSGGGAGDASGETPDETGAIDTGAGRIDDGGDATPGDVGSGCMGDPGAPSGDAGSGTSDPVGGAGRFTLDQALAGFPAGAGVLTASITTELGVIVCQLDDKNAPITVANFVGLARGTRPAQRASATWTLTRFYDGLIFHRVIPDFVIQGGDPAGSGSGGPGYDLPNENRVVEPKGTLAMAAYPGTDDAGATVTISSGSQFYVVVGKGPSADYNVFGTCSTDVATAIANVPASASGRPKTPVHLLHVDISRCPK